MTIIVDFPRAIGPKLALYQIIGQTRSMTQSLSGIDQTAASLASRWHAMLEFPYLSVDDTRTFRAIIAELEGRQNALRIPVFDRRFLVDLSGITGTATHSDGSTFSDGSAYSSVDVSDVEVSGSRGETSVDVDLSAYDIPSIAGCYFGINDDLYLASRDYRDSSGNGELRFRTSLRRDYTDATFRLRPVLIAKQKDDAGGAIAIEAGIKGAPNLELMEHFIV